MLQGLALDKPLPLGPVWLWLRQPTGNGKNTRKLQNRAVPFARERFLFHQGKGSGLITGPAS
jgi:hypothetical protein